MHYETCGGVKRRCGEVTRQIRTADLLLERVCKSTFLRLNRFNFRTNAHHNLDRNLGNVCLKNRPGIRENFAGKIGIRKTTQGIENPLKFEIQNPTSTYNDCNSVHGMRNPWLSTVSNSHTWREGCL